MLWPKVCVSSRFKGTVSRLCARANVIFFSSKDNRTVRFPSGLHRTGFLFTFSSNILDFRRSFLSHLLNLARGTIEDSSRCCRLQGRLATRRSPSARFNCSKSSNICLICSPSSLKRLKDVNKNAISTRLIIAKVTVSQKLYYDFIALVFLNT